MTLSYKVADWLLLIFTSLWWAFIASVSFEQWQIYLTDGRYGMFGSPADWIISGLYVWVPVAAVLFLIKYVCGRYISEPERRSSGSKKAKLIFLALVVVCAVIGIVVNWLY